LAGRHQGRQGRHHHRERQLIAAAHAGCFTMALSLILGEAKLTATEMETSATVSLEQVDGGYAITAVHLALRAKVPGADQETFTKLAGMAKAGCPVSKLLKTEITLDAMLIP
jgi:osmotically inducible protein OsmC